VYLVDLTEIPIEAIYQAIGQLIVAGIPEAWLSATAHAEIKEDDHGLTFGVYTPALAPAEEKDFATGYRFYFLFKELRRRLRRPGYAPWVKARFTLYPDGHFDLDFTYPDVGDSVAQPTAWQRLKQSWLDAVEQGEAPQVSLQVLFDPDQPQPPAGLDVATRRAGRLSTVTFQGIPAGYDAALIRPVAENRAQQAGVKPEEAL